MKSEVKAHSGHMGRSVVQRHSAGDIFPYRVDVIGNGVKEGWCVLMGPITAPVASNVPLRCWDYREDGGRSFREAHKLAEGHARRLLGIA